MKGSAQRKQQIKAQNSFCIAVQEKKPANFSQAAVAIAVFASTPLSSLKPQPCFSRQTGTRARVLAFCISERASDDEDVEYR